MFVNLRSSADAGRDHQRPEERHDPDLPEGLFQVVEFQHVKPGKGGAFVRTKLKNVRTGAVIDRTYRADEKLEQAIIDKREMQYLYHDGDRLRLHGQRDLRPAATSRRRRSATPPST